MVAESLRLSAAEGHDTCVKQRRYLWAIGLLQRLYQTQRNQNISIRRPWDEVPVAVCS